MAKKDMRIIAELKEVISKEKKIVSELTSIQKYYNEASEGEKGMLDSQIKSMKDNLKQTNSQIPVILDKILTAKKLNPDWESTAERAEDKWADKNKLTNKNAAAKPKQQILPYTERGYSLRELKPTVLEKQTIKRMKEKDIKKEEIKEQQANVYVKFANKLFSNYSEQMVKDKTFELERDLIKANLPYTERSYISMIFLTTLIAIVASIIIALFFLFFNLSASMPIISKATDIAPRIWKVLLIVLFAPILTFIFMYTYPGLERGASESRINEELPFATIHMSAISGSMIDPSKIFDIIITTHEYPYLEKEFKKLLNEINLYGYDLVSALRTSSFNSPSKKLAELFNGLATTINSGGDLPAFFDKRSQTLLFENRLEQEKKTKAAETFMDMYISLVVAAPMILMILLMMMKISGLGISMSTQMITVVMVMAVAGINAVFLTFLQLKR